MIAVISIMNAIAMIGSNYNDVDHDSEYDDSSDSYDFYHDFYEEESLLYF